MKADSSNTKFDKILSTIKNHRSLSVIIFMGLLVITLANFTNALDSLIKKIIPNDKDRVVISAIKTRDNSEGIPHLLDIFVRNTGSSEAVIHQAELIILELIAIEYWPEGAWGGGIHPTFQYNALMTHNDKKVTIDMAQSVPANKSDRFLIAVILGDDKYSGLIERPWADFFQIKDEQNRFIKSITAKMFLRLIYNENRIVESQHFNFNISSSWSPYSTKAKIIADPRFKDKFKHLYSEDLSTVESILVLLTELADDSVLVALKNFRNNRLIRLKEKWEQLSPYEQEYRIDVLGEPHISKITQKVDRLIAVLEDKRNNGS